MSTSHSTVKHRRKLHSNLLNIIHKGNFITDTNRFSSTLLILSSPELVLSFNCCTRVLDIFTVYTFFCTCNIENKAFSINQINQLKIFALLTPMPHSHFRPRLRLHQIATLCLWDVAPNAENGYGTQSLRLTQIMQKTHSVNGA